MQIETKEVYEKNGYVLEINIKESPKDKVITGFINKDNIITIYIDNNIPSIGSSSCFPTDPKKGEAMNYLYSLVFEKSNLLLS